MGLNNRENDRTMEMAEADRQATWNEPGFMAGLFQGDFRWDLVHPFPTQPDEDRRVGDDLIERIHAVFDVHLDPVQVDETRSYPRAVLDKLTEVGLFGMKIPQAYGGLGLSQTNYARVLSFIGSYCQSTATRVSAHQGSGAVDPLLQFGTTAQKTQFLPRLAQGALSAFALTEADAGSDPTKVTTTATPGEDGTHYILNGRKLWTTNGPDAELIVVIARTPSITKYGVVEPQITAFLVETEWAGVETEQRCDFMGLRGLSNGVLSFDQVRVPTDHLIGEPGQGLEIALATLNTGRLGVSAAMAGACKKLLLECERWTRGRVQGGAPIGDHQAVAGMTARMAAETFAMESLVQLCGSLADQENTDLRLEAVAAKYFCTETAWRVTDDFLQVRGGRGYETETSLYRRGSRPVPAERFLRDVRAGRLSEGSSQMMQIIMARAALDTHFRLIMPLIQPKPGQQGGVLRHLGRAARFYLTWYPGTWMPLVLDFNTSHLEDSNRQHLAFAAKTARRLARALFHTMARYRVQTEREQLLLANFVDIGVDLFVMGAVLVHAEYRTGENPADRTAQDLADLFCKEARLRIARNFDAVKHHHNDLMGRMSRALMAGKYRWLARDVYEDLPSAYRDYDTISEHSEGMDP